MPIAPIMLFGTSRFLQAHVALFVSETPELADHRPITVVQTSGDATRAKRLQALAHENGFPIEIRGVEDGRDIRHSVQVTSVGATFALPHDLDAIREKFVHETEIVISNASDAGWVPQSVDEQAAFHQDMSFPAKLRCLLEARFAAGGRPIQVMPTELVPQNGAALRDLVLASTAGRSSAFAAWIKSEVIFVNTLVDRIVSAPLEPAGAVAEPYALWAIEDGPGIDIPWQHPAIMRAPSLDHFEALKLFILNLFHTFMVDQWQQGAFGTAQVVRDVMAQPVAVAQLRNVFETEVQPGFAAAGLGKEAAQYFATTLDRFRNPYLDHKLADIAFGHPEKITRRIAGYISWAQAAGYTQPMPQLEAVVAGTWPS